MKTLKTLFATAIIASVTLAGTAQADELMDIIHPESADLFDHSTSINASSQTGLFSLNNDGDTQVWSYEFEQYVNPDDLNSNNYADINQYLEANPTAAGAPGEDVFKWDPTYDGFMIY
ncbi:MAG: hypothetical protein KAI22_01175 [Gammaproteobacteria bacterium]|nr:hypothetical protein [Gammaproteobacteria bacterium]